METRVLNHRRSSLIARLLALALLFGQFGAEAHAYSHLADGSKGLPDATQVCLACFSFAPLGSALGGSPSVSPLDPCVEETVISLDPILVPRGPSHPAFRSRAPPALL